MMIPKTKPQPTGWDGGTGLICLIELYSLVGACVPIGKELGWYLIFRLVGWDGKELLVLLGLLWRLVS